MPNPNTILVKGNPARREGVTGAAVTPGHLVTLNSAGAIIPHASAVTFAPKAFALENELFGKEITSAYASGESARYGVFAPGEEVYALLPAAAAAVIVGDILVSSGDGTLKKTTASTNYPIAMALEAVDNSAGGAAVRIRVAVL